MIADDVKGAILQWLRFERQYAYVATEVGSYSADILAANNDHLIEVEVKVDFYDLKKDFEKRKHGEYNEAEKRGHRSYEWYHIPNRFYFAVPKHLEESAKKILDTKNQKYGLLVIGTTAQFHPHIPKLTVHCAKPARLIHKDPPGKDALTTIAKRMSSELCGFYAGDYSLRSMGKTFREAGRVWSDPEMKEEIL